MRLIFQTQNALRYKRIKSQKVYKSFVIDNSKLTLRTYGFQSNLIYRTIGLSLNNRDDLFIGVNPGVKHSQLILLNFPELNNRFNVMRLRKQIERGDLFDLVIFCSQAFQISR